MNIALPAIVISFAVDADTLTVAIVAAFAVAIVAIVSKIIVSFLTP